MNNSNQCCVCYAENAPRTTNTYWKCAGKHTNRVCPKCADRIRRSSHPLCPICREGVRTTPRNRPPFSGPRVASPQPPQHILRRIMESSRHNLQAVRRNHSTRGTIARRPNNSSQRLPTANTRRQSRTPSPGEVVRPHTARPNTTRHTTTARRQSRTPSPGEVVRPNTARPNTTRSSSRAGHRSRRSTAIGPYRGFTSDRECNELTGFTMDQLSHIVHRFGV